MTRPSNPLRDREIFLMRSKKKMKWRVIADFYKMSHSSVWQAYQRGTNPKTVDEHIKKVFETAMKVDQLKNREIKDNEIKKTLNRDENIKELRKRGYSMVKISQKFQISKQRVHQILQKKIQKRYCKICTQLIIGFATKYCNDCKLLKPKYCIECKEKLKKGTYQKKYCMKCQPSKKLSGREYVREVIRIRDNRTCQICDQKWQKGQRRFDIHHIGGSEGGKSKQYDKIENTKGLVTLCHKCHLNLHHGNVFLKAVEN